MRNKNNRWGLSKILVLSLGISVMVVVSLLACSENVKATFNFTFMDPPSPGAAAKIKGKLISDQQLMESNKLEFQNLEDQKYKLKMAQLKQIMLQEIIGEQAQKAGMSLESYIDKKVAGDVKMTAKDYSKFIAERKMDESKISPPLKEKIEAFIKAEKKQAAVDKLLAKESQKEKIEVYFKRQKTLMDIEIGNAPVAGSPNAPVSIVVFSDFQCPFCGRAAETLADIRKQYGKRVKIAFKHYPLPMHNDARPASEASMCVYDQNKDKFWAYHDTLFKNQTKLDRPSLEKYAKDVGVNVNKFNDCMNGKKFADFVQKDMDYASKLGIQSTPTSFINGEIVPGALPMDQWAEKIDEAELEAKNANKKK